MSTASTPYNRIPGFYRQETVRKYAPSSSQCEPYDPEHLSMPRERIVAEAIRVGTGSDQAAVSQRKHHFIEGGFVARLAWSGGLEEYQFHLLREKQHSLVFGQILVWEHRRAIPWVCAILFFSSLSAFSKPVTPSPSNGSLPRPTHPRSVPVLFSLHKDDS